MNHAVRWIVIVRASLKKKKKNLLKRKKKIFWGCLRWQRWQCKYHVDESVEYILDSSIAEGELWSPNSVV